MTMRQLPPLSTFLAIIGERKRALGITDEAYARARNRGRRRSPEKRELLRRIDRRARQAGLDPFKSAVLIGAAPHRPLLLAVVGTP
jgi:hypothetical protein